MHLSTWCVARLSWLTQDRTIPSDSSPGTESLGAVSRGEPVSSWYNSIIIIIIIIIIIVVIVIIAPNHLSCYLDDTTDLMGSLTSVLYVCALLKKLHN